MGVECTDVVIGDLVLGGESLSGCILVFRECSGVLGRGNSSRGSVCVSAWADECVLLLGCDEGVCSVWLCVLTSSVSGVNVFVLADAFNLGAGTVGSFLACLRRVGIVWGSVKSVCRRNVQYKNV